jgi:transposase
MRVTYSHCAGIDVHKKMLMVCRIIPDSQDGWEEETRQFGTTTEELLKLADWLQAGEVTQVALESTGVYWRPVFNILESSFEVMVVNAQHIKQVPGRKTDVKDAQWIADLLQHGLLKASFIPEQPQRDLRELLRYRTRLVQERTQEINRVHKVLEDANIKLGDVVSDMMGVSARAMLVAILAGEENPQALAQLARRKMRSKIPALQLALQGHVRQTHRVLLGLHLQHIDALDAMLQDLQQSVEQLLPPFDQDQLLARLDTIPGVGSTTAQIIVAEIGTDMTRFANANHLASWAGLAPGKNQSAGRNYSAKIAPGNRHLRNILIEAAHAVGHTKDNYLAAQYRRLAARRGKKRAAVAVAHSILKIAFHIIKNGTSYVDLGSAYFDQRDQQATQRRAIRRLEALGFKVTLDPVAA